MGSPAASTRSALNMLSTKVVRAKAARPSGAGSAMLAAAGSAGGAADRAGSLLARAASMSSAMVPSSYDVCLWGHWLRAATPPCEKKKTEPTARPGRGAQRGDPDQGAHPRMGESANRLVQVVVGTRRLRREVVQQDDVERGDGPERGHYHHEEDLAILAGH